MLWDAYPNLKEKQDYIRKVISLEEERFYATIDQGTSILEEYMKQVEKGSNTLTGRWSSNSTIPSVSAGSDP